MLFEELEIAGVWKVSSAIHSDNRGMFREWFKSSEVEQITGEKFDVQQANISTSKRGVIRGMHYSNSSAGQGKWVTCVYGSIWDYDKTLNDGLLLTYSWILEEISKQKN